MVDKVTVSVEHEVLTPAEDDGFMLTLVEAEGSEEGVLPGTEAELVPELEAEVDGVLMLAEEKGFETGEDAGTEAGLVPGIEAGADGVPMLMKEEDGFEAGVVGMDFVTVQSVIVSIVAEVTVWVLLL